MYVVAKSSEPTDHAILVRQTPNQLSLKVHLGNIDKWTFRPSGKLVTLGQIVQITTKAPAFPIEYQQNRQFCCNIRFNSLFRTIWFPLGGLAIQKCCRIRNKMLKLSQNASGEGFSESSDLYLQPVLEPSPLEHTDLKIHQMDTHIWTTHHKRSPLL